ncbi:hypothetical protein LTR97_003603 [Elasticomyces elasticus]|uniref:F-box domain-containing protein n=1 Tax=Elasticomyces elasticus TaxID=574655 RepID=A0AAN7W7V9_9PEZI|nr:hypothetical protein LTR97_003603 [Elasticomyces elasticus]
MATLQTGFLHLPVEIRNRIYELALIQGIPIDLHRRPNELEFIAGPSLLRTTSLVRSECTAIYYGANIFIASPAKLTRLLLRLAHGRLRLLRKLRLNSTQNDGRLKLWSREVWFTSYEGKLRDLENGPIGQLIGLRTSVRSLFQFPLSHVEAGVLWGPLRGLRLYQLAEKEDGYLRWVEWQESQNTRVHIKALVLHTVADMADSISPFMRLPPEIRNSICDLVLIHEEPIILRPYGTDHIDESGLLRTNHQLRQDARPIYFGMNTFIGSVYGVTRFMRTVERNQKLPVLKHLRCDNDSRDLQDRKVYGSVDHLDQDRWLKDHIDSMLAISARLNKNGMTVSVPRIEFPLRHGQAGIIWGTILELQEYDVVVRSGEHAWVRSEQSYEDVAEAFALFAMIVDGAKDEVPTA